MSLVSPKSVGYSLSMTLGLVISIARCEPPEETPGEQMVAPQALGVKQDDVSASSFVSVLIWYIRCLKTSWNFAHGSLAEPAKAQIDDLAGHVKKEMRGIPRSIFSTLVTDLSEFRKNYRIDAQHTCAVATFYAKVAGEFKANELENILQGYPGASDDVKACIRSLDDGNLADAIAPWLTAFLHEKDAKLVAALYNTFNVFLDIFCSVAGNLDQNKQMKDIMLLSSFFDQKLAYLDDKYYNTPYINGHMKSIPEDFEPIRPSGTQPGEAMQLVIQKVFDIIASVLVSFLTPTDNILREVVKNATTGAKEGEESKSLADFCVLFVNAFLYTIDEDPATVIDDLSSTFAVDSSIVSEFLSKDQYNLIFAILGAYHKNGQMFKVQCQTIISRWKGIISKIKKIQKFAVKALKEQKPSHTLSMDKKSLIPSQELLEFIEKTISFFTQSSTTASSGKASRHLSGGFPGHGRKLGFAASGQSPNPAARPPPPNVKPNIPPQQPAQKVMPKTSEEHTKEFEKTVKSVSGLFGKLAGPKKQPASGKKDSSESEVFTDSEQHAKSNEEESTHGTGSSNGSSKGTSRDQPTANQNKNTNTQASNDTSTTKIDKKWIVILVIGGVCVLLLGFVGAFYLKK